MTEQERREAQGDRVLMARAGARLSREKMATAVSNLWQPISREYIRRIEEGEVDPGYGFFLAASTVTGQPVDWFTVTRELSHNLRSVNVGWFPRPIDFQVDTATLVAAA
jgi:transcriptional regulator with XRE-family HTH domain